MPVFELEGELDIYTVDTFRGAIAVLDEVERVIVDVRSVELIDSSGLGALLALVQGPHGPRRVALICMGSTVPRLLELTRLRDQFIVATSVEEGLEEFATGRM